MDRNTKHILIVEDDKLLSFVEERLIKKLGYQLAGKATNGKDAIESVKEKNPDLILMDINLDSSMDGIEAMNRIREFSSVPVVFLTGDSQQKTEDRINCISNCVDYLVKPVNADGLQKPLEKAFNESSTKDLQAKTLG